jgi:hypothetical protein
MAKSKFLMKALCSKDSRLFFPESDKKGINLQFAAGCIVWGFLSDWLDPKSTGAIALLGNDRTINRWFAVIN